jgi:hypothetical protein
MYLVRKKGLQFILAAPVALLKRHEDVFEYVVCPHSVPYVPRVRDPDHEDAGS